MLGPSMVRTAIVLGGLLSVLVLDIAASVRVGRWDVVTSSQKAAWFVLICHFAPRGQHRRQAAIKRHSIGKCSCQYAIFCCEPHG